MSTFLKLELGVNGPAHQQTIAFSALGWHCWLGITKSIWPVKVEWQRGGMVLSGVRCKWFAYGPADATATLSSLTSLKCGSFTCLVPTYLGCPGKHTVQILLIYKSVPLYLQNQQCCISGFCTASMIMTHSFMSSLQNACVKYSAFLRCLVASDVISLSDLQTSFHNLLTWLHDMKKVIWLCF